MRLEANEQKVVLHQIRWYGQTASLVIVERACTR